MRSEILRRGEWRYGDVLAFTWVVREDRDVFHEEWDDPPPDLGDDGWAY